MQEFYTVSEVAKIMRVSVKSTRRRIQNGDFPNWIKPGKSYLIPQSDLKNLLQEELGRREP